MILAILTTANNVEISVSANVINFMIKNHFEDILRFVFVTGKYEGAL